MAITYRDKPAPPRNPLVSALRFTAPGLLALASLAAFLVLFGILNFGPLTKREFKIGMPPFWDAVVQAQGSPPGNPPPPDKTASDLKRFEDRLDIYAKRFDSLMDMYSRRVSDAQWLLAMVVLVAGLATGIQAILAYFNAQNFVKQGTDAVAEVKKKGDEVLKEFEKQAQAASKQIEEKGAETLDQVKQRFPALLGFEGMLQQILAELTKNFDDADLLGDEFYSKMNPGLRQRVIYYEKTISGYELLDVPKFHSQIGESFRGLGSFYASKYSSDRSKCAAALSALDQTIGGLIAKGVQAEALALAPLIDHLQGALAPQREDLYRAIFYLERALVRNPNDFAAFNWLGHVFSELLAPDVGKTDRPRAAEYIVSAKGHFETSWTIQPRQLRAPYNLGTIAFNARDYPRADKYFRDALTLGNDCPWEFDVRPGLALRIPYNLACTLCRSEEASPDASKGRLNEALALLETAVHADATQSLQSTVAGDLKENGDLYLIASKPEFGHRVDRVKAVEGLPVSGVIDGGSH